MIVFDASTLILLAKIDMLDVFVSSFHGKIMIPELIRDEVCVRGREETPLVTRLIEDKKIYVSKVKTDKAVKKIMDDFHIDAGEAEAIILALREKASLVATDDRNAIRACKALKLDFTTAVAILIRAFEKKLIDKAEALLKMQKLESVARYKRSIIEEAENLIEGGE
jgi:predicted nucleic acid-binding protein